jgi:hypothetical protein
MNYKPEGFQANSMAPPPPPPQYKPLVTSLG